MASRPVFIPVATWPFVRVKDFEFHWNPGFAAVQKKKNIRGLHDAASAVGLAPLLEISTKSEEKLGTRLSAFSLKVSTDEGGEVHLENAFQASKRFEQGGPFLDLLTVHPRDAKRDPRLRSSGELRGFDWRGFNWPLVPRTVFYDWLYISALAPHEEFLEERLAGYKGFTDIEFNPKRSINCQARACAVLSSLLSLGLLREATESPEAFLKVMRPNAAGRGLGQEEEPQRELF